MAVRAEGYCGSWSSSGEAGFRSRAQWLGYRHEDFSLMVRRAQLSGPVDGWTASYTVCVTDLRTSRSNVYWEAPARIGSRSSRPISRVGFGEPRILRASPVPWRERAGG